MGQFLSILIDGLSIGGVYALVALGMVIVYRATAVINFAHPSLLVLGTFVAVSLRTDLHWPFGPAVAAGVVLTVVVSVLIDLVLVRPFRKHNAVLAAGIMTIGLSIMLTSLTTEWIGAQILPSGLPFGSSTVSLWGVGVPGARLAALGTAAVLLVGFRLWLQRSRFGLDMRAAAEDPETAELMGIRLTRVSVVAWSLAAVLAVIAGVFLVSYPSAGLDVTVTGVALQAIPAVVVGGIDSTTGAVVGGLAVGLVQTFALGYQSDLAFLGRSFYTAAPYLLMLAVLLVKPAGLFGTPEVHRV